MRLPFHDIIERPNIELVGRWKEDQSADNGRTLSTAEIRELERDGKLKPPPVAHRPENPMARIRDRY